MIDPNDSELVEVVCTNPLDKNTWGEWRAEFLIGGLKITQDDSGFMDSKILTAAEARTAFALCTYERVPPMQDMDESHEVATVELIRPAQDLTVEGIKTAVLPQVAKKMTVGEWRRMYDKVSKNPPVDGFIQAEEGPIRMEVELHPGKAPFIFTRLYIRNIVGVEPAWFGQGEKQTNSFGWKVVLLPKSRDEVIKKLGVTKNVVFVKMIRIIKMSESKRSLLGEVVEW